MGAGNGGGAPWPLQATAPTCGCQLAAVPTWGQCGSVRSLSASTSGRAAGAPGLPHCDDVKAGAVSTLNGFPIQCPRAEGGLVGKLSGWKAVGVVNRFDLAPAGAPARRGAHEPACAAARRVGAKR